jgi:hypothetical protein
MNRTYRAVQETDMTDISIKLNAARAGKIVDMVSIAKMPVRLEGNEKPYNFMEFVRLHLTYNVMRFVHGPTSFLVVTSLQTKSIKTFLESTNEPFIVLTTSKIDKYNIDHYRLLFQNYIEVLFTQNDRRGFSLIQLERTRANAEVRSSEHKQHDELLVPLRKRPRVPQIQGIRAKYNGPRNQPEEASLQTLKYLRSRIPGGDITLSELIMVIPEIIKHGDSLLATRLLKMIQDDVHGDIVMHDVLSDLREGNVKMYREITKPHWGWNGATRNAMAEVARAAMMLTPAMGRNLNNPRPL